MLQILSEADVVVTDIDTFTEERYMVVGFPGEFSWGIFNAIEFASLFEWLPDRNEATFSPVKMIKEPYSG